MKYKILTVMALLVNAYLIQSCNDSTKTTSTTTEMDSSMNHTMPNDSMHSVNMNMNNAMMQSMTGMMGKMDAMTMTGDFDLDFANMMIIHHQAAIDMSEVQVTKGNDPQIKTMAQNIITAQKAEIEKMQQMVKDYNMPEVKKQAGKMHNELGESMKVMMGKINSMPMTGNTDKDYVMMMIPHHEAAVKMAEEEIGNGQLPALKNMAKKMVEDQNNEIKEFQLWLDKNK
jgi:uncharacterized protein (DUF305 family)